MSYFKDMLMSEKHRRHSNIFHVNLSSSIGQILNGQKVLFSEKIKHRLLSTGTYVIVGPSFNQDDIRCFGSVEEIHISNKNGHHVQISLEALDFIIDNMAPGCWVIVTNSDEFHSPWM